MTDALPPPSGMLEQLQEYARLLPQQPVPSRLEAGAAVLDVLRAGLGLPSAGPAPWGVSPAAALTALPMVQNDELGPAGWRLLDSEGAVITSGTLSLRDWEARS